MHKNTKKIYKTFLFLLLGIILLPVVVSFLLLLPSVQTFLVKKVAFQLSQTYHAEITVEGVYVSPMGRISLNHLLLKDQQGDSMLYANRVRGSLNNISFSSQHIGLKMVSIEEPFVRLVKNDSLYNFSFLFSAPDTTVAKPWHIETAAFELLNGTFRFVSNDTVNRNTKFDVSNIRVNNLNMLMKQIAVTPDSIAFNLEHLSFFEASGAKVTNCGFTFFKSATKMGLAGFHLATDHSSVVCDTISVAYDSIAQLALSPADLRYKLLVDSAKIAPADLGLFSQWADSIKAPIAIKGRFTGSLPNIKGSDVTLSFGNQTLMQSNFNVVGLPRVAETFLFLDITDMSTNSVDLGLLLGSLPGSKVKALPESFKQLGTIKYKGNFTGFINDLVAYGKFSTSLGSISTDIGVKITDRVTFSGNLNTVGFDLGRMFRMREQIGKLTMKMTVNGSHVSKNNYFAYLKGEIDSVSIRNYTIRRIELNGLLANKKFDGQVEVNDPAGQLHFIGNIDYSQEIPNFNFYARLHKVKLEYFKLNPLFDHTDISLDVVSNFDGATPDDLTGFFRVDNAVIARPNAAYKIDSLVVSAQRANDKKYLTVRSDLLTAEIKGRYNFIHLANDIAALAYNYLPALKQPKSTVVPSGLNDFTFHLYANKLGQFVNFVDSAANLSPGIVFEGRFNPQKNDFLLDGEMPFARFGKMNAQNMIVNINSNDQLAMALHFDNLALWNKLELKNFAVQQLAKNNGLSTSIFWNNWEASTNSGALFTNTVFSRADTLLVSTIAIDASQILVKDTVWNITPCAIELTENGFSVDNFRIWHNNQQVAVNGTVQKGGNDGIYGYMRNINLSQVLSNVKLGGITMGGMLNAEFKAQNLYLNPSIIGEVTIDDFTFNKQDMGRLLATSNWNLAQNALEIETVLGDADNPKINGKCKYFIESQMIDYEGTADKCEIGFLDIWLKSIVQNIRGTASGRVWLNGKISSPVLTAKVKVNDGRFDVGLLKTSYTLSDSVEMEPRRIVMKNMTLKDRNNHQGVFDGVITHNQFGDMGFDLSVRANNMLALDTRSKDNPLYYGTVYATGALKVTGSVDKITIDITGKSMPNTQFFIPVQNSASVEQNKYIRFSSPKSTIGVTSGGIAPDYRVDLSGIEMNMDLEITPDAKMQIIFDERMGDILKGTGRGDIQMKIDKYSNISMFGDYNIEDGDYLFTLQNVINKRFVIESGSHLKWDGDPFNAVIDITAIYKLRTNLYDLMGASANEYESDLTKRVPVNCNLYLTDRLSRPSIRFGIETPTLEQSQSALLKEYIHTEEEMNRQVLSLLILNRFYSPETQRVSEQSADRGGANPAVVTTTEMLSNQFSNWLSQINQDVDVDINYRPGDEITSQEIEVALSTQLFNDRVSISTNVGYEDQQSSAKTTSIVGDFEMNVKLNPSGTIRAHGYTRTNNDIVYLSTAPNKQGVGLSFREEFNQWADLFDKYWAIINGDDKKRKKKGE